MRQKNVYLAWFGFHFFLIVAISLRELLWAIAAGTTMIPVHSGDLWSQAEKITATISGQRLLESNPGRKVLLGYLHSAGIEGAFNFFAPNVPENYKLAFEFRYPDGHVEYDLPNVASRTASLRLGSLLDRIGRDNSEQFQRVLIRMLTTAAWQYHDGAISAKAVFGVLKLPTIDEFERGVRPSHQFLFAYEFSAKDQ